MSNLAKGVVALSCCCLMSFGAEVLFAADGQRPEPQITVENKPKVTIKIGTEILDGDTTYQIGYPVTMSGQIYEGYFPFSELEWPLDVTMGRIAAGVAFSRGIKLNLLFKKNLSDPDGTMKDSDWLTASDPSRLDVYSESNISSFSGVVFDINTTWSFVEKPKYSFFAGLGFQYQRFEFDAKLISQYSPSGLPGFDYEGDGELGIKYNISYYMPYLKVGGEIRPNDKLLLSAAVSYSPYTAADDEDRHLLREYGGKATKGNMDGTAFMFDLSGTYYFTPIWFAELGMNYTSIDVDGTMDQSYVWFGEFASNKVEAESSQFSGYLNLGATF